MTTRTQLADPRNLRTASVGRKMNRAEATALTQQIRATAHGLWKLVAEAYDRKAWQALGYTGWKQYAEEELQMSESRSYQLVDTGRVMRAIGEVAGESAFESVVVTARETAKIKPHLSTFKKEVQKAVKDGVPVEDAVETAIQNLPIVEKKERRKADIVLPDGTQIDVKKQVIEEPEPQVPAWVASHTVPAPAPAAAPVVASPFAAPTGAVGPVGEMFEDDDEFQELIALLQEVYDKVSPKALGPDLRARIKDALTA